ncbi:hypothetical protein MTO96_050722, partial [Rhipicephalus appendiculatus]
RPEVTNLQLGAVDADTFALKWEQPGACFDYYTVEVTDESTYKRSVVTCNNGLVIKPNQTSVTCEQMKTCANVTIRVKTHTRGPPELSSTGAVLRHVFLLGKAPTEPTDLRFSQPTEPTFLTKTRSGVESLVEDVPRLEGNAGSVINERPTSPVSCHKLLPLTESYG